MKQKILTIFLITFSWALFPAIFWLVGYGIGDVYGKSLPIDSPHEFDRIINAAHYGNAVGIIAALPGVFLSFLLTGFILTAGDKEGQSRAIRSLKITLVWFIVPLCILSSCLFFSLATIIQ